MIKYVCNLIRRTTRVIIAKASLSVFKKITKKMTL